ncbi:hypothetical protein [Castellaniella caeni]|uniref:hypothetical protein n=1 Tax=Castellaniella caeni TaxID=266123 RepID=UPI000C9ED179|nr:hypothetical protein [Castellaniella caeni]
MSTPTAPTRFLVRVSTPLTFHEFIHEGSRAEAEERAINCACPDGESTQPFVVLIKPITIH